MIKYFPWFLFSCALCIIVYLFYLLLYGGAALDNARTEVERLSDRSSLALLIIQKNWIGSDSAKLANLSEIIKSKGSIVKHNEGTYEIGDIIFETANGVVVSVRYSD